MIATGWDTNIREGYQTKTIRVGNCIVTVHRPILTNAERRKIEDQVKIGLLNLVAKENEEEKAS